MVLTSAFELLPAIDIRNGRVVRLERGDFDRETTFSDDPARVAGDFARAGARWLHVVDLDGARSGETVNDSAIDGIYLAVGGAASVEVAGGLRSVDAVARAIERGAARAVVGTAVLSDPAFGAELIVRFGAPRIAVAVDVRGGLARGEAWRDGASGVPPEDLIEGLANVGVELFEVTSIDRDGLLGGPDLELLRRLVALGRGQILASGGIRHVDDLRAVRQLGCSGAIVGRALYDGSLKVEDAIAALDDRGAMAREPS
jgi:phosphoribosylformimino-5-aminoimidazole carboxamide ribotide isomerase